VASIEQIKTLGVYISNFRSEK